MERTIFHIDVNSAYLSWEAVYRLKHLGGTLDLREVPSAVGGDMAMRHGIILAKSIPAKQYRIQTGETIVEAKHKCPSLLLVPPHYDLYEKASEAFFRILQQYSPKVEPYSIDEFYMDMSGMLGDFASPIEVAEEIRERVYQELGFTVNVGISCNKVLAKMASDFQKPNRVHTLYPAEIPAKMWPLPVSDLFFVGRATTKKLYLLGIHTIGELAAADPILLSSHLKKHGRVIWSFANGIDPSQVEPEAPPQKGYGNSTTTPMDVVDANTAKMVLLSLAESVAARLRADQVRTGLISLGIKDDCLQYASHQKVLLSPTDGTQDIYQAASLLLDELWDGTPIRHLGIHSGKIQKNEEPRQLQLFEEEKREKLIRLDQAVDEIRGRFGQDAIKRAVFLGQPIDHISGGISREKRTI